MGCPRPAFRGGCKGYFGLQSPYCGRHHASDDCYDGIRLHPHRSRYRRDDCRCPDGRYRLPAQRRSRVQDDKLGDNRPFCRDDAHVAGAREDWRIGLHLQRSGPVHWRLRPARPPRRHLLHCLVDDNVYQQHRNGPADGAHRPAERPPVGSKPGPVPLRRYRCRQYVLRVALLDAA